MKVFLLRHAMPQAASCDEERPLAPEGYKQIDKLCAHINSEIFANCAEVWHSPYLRASQTAQSLISNMNISAPRRPMSGMIPSADPEKFAKDISSIACMGADLLLVGHNPFLESLTSILLGRNNFYQVHFMQCTLVCLDLEEPPSECAPFGLWSLSLIVSPNILGE